MSREVTGGAQGLALARVEHVYIRVFQEVDLALTRGDYDRAISMVRNAASGHPKVVPSPEDITGGNQVGTASHHQEQ